MNLLDEETMATGHPLARILRSWLARVFSGPFLSCTMPQQSRIGGDANLATT